MSERPATGASRPSSGSGEGPSPGEQRHHRLERWIPWGLVLVTLGVWSPVLHLDFVWDDRPLIEENPAVLEADFAALWSSDFWAASARGRDSGYYRPLVSSTYALDGLLWGLNPTGFHLTNLLLHVLNVLLVWRVVRRRFGGLELALGAALFFAIQPIQSEAVACVTARTDLLSAAGMLSTLSLLLSRAAPGRLELLRLPGLALLSALGLFSKESAVMVLPLGLWAVVGMEPSERRRCLTGLLAVGGGLGLALLVRAQVLAGGALGGLGSRADAAGLAGGLSLSAFVEYPFHLLYYLARWSVPVGLSPRYPEVAVPATTAALALVSGLACIFLAGQKGRWRSAGVFGLGWFGLAVTPTAFLMGHGLRISDLFVYLGGAGAALTLADWLRGGTARTAGKLAPNLSWRAGAGAGLVLGMAVLSRIQLPVWADDISLWSHTTERYPDDGLAWMNLGNGFSRQGRHQEAGTALARALEAFERRPPVPGEEELVARAWYNLGNHQRRQGEANDALKSYARALELAPWLSPAYVNLSQVLLALGQPVIALEVAERGLELGLERDPARGRLLNQAGVAAAAQGALDKAEEFFVGAVEGWPGDGEARYNLERLRERGATGGTAAPDDLRDLGTPRAAQ